MYNCLNILMLNKFYKTIHRKSYLKTMYVFVINSKENMSFSTPFLFFKIVKQTFMNN